MRNVLLVLVALIMLPACTPAQSAAGKAYGINLLACEATHVPQVLTGFVGDAEQILLDNAPDYQQQLKNLGRSDGVMLASDTITCAVQAAIALLEQQLAAPATPGAKALRLRASGASPTAADIAAAVARGKVFLGQTSNP